jgi:hypothetical protein
MNISKTEFDKYIKECRHETLFNVLGWDKGKDTLSPIKIGDEMFHPRIIAEKRGFQIISCDAEKIPVLAVRLKIANELKKLYQKNIIIFTNESKWEQVWLHLYTRDNRVKKVDIRYTNGQDTERIYQRASGLIFELDEQDNITIVDVSKRVSENFAQNTERVRKRFYDNFKKQHTMLLKFIKGIKDTSDKEWYASIILNRLMFCYFMQRRRFLNNDRDYLKNKLNKCKAEFGKDKFYSFYRNFLRVLFEKGFGTYEHDNEIKKMIGDIPYLNGGLFDIHEVERKYADINISDEAFENIFAFFDTYEWHLDSRDCATGNEINPDVLGYIFEKYINDRAKMGAYYTQEDITDYISRNSILPYLLESANAAYPQAFERDGAVWEMLKNSGDKYIFESVKKGVNEPLPENIAAGLDTEAPDLLKRREHWNKTAPEEYALPTEIWREVIERRKRYEEVSTLIKKGKITEINDFITYNLDITSFVIDLLDNIEDPKFIQEFYKNLQKITVLDPTCGSGAFLFAARNIMEPLYDSCLNRMSDYLSHDYKGSLERGLKKFFEENLKLMNNEIHPSKQYFIYKSIILNNLYGVDIMHEAVETAKLRLFLKLVSTADPDYTHKNIGIEPLPDIDFNIKAGNTLVGIANQEEIKLVMFGNAFGAQFENQIKTDMKDFAHAISEYKDLQLEENGYNDDNFHNAKKKLINMQNKLKNTLDDLLRESQYTGMPKEKWQIDYMPFHWVAEFHSIIVNNKGFDVIIGNPPYVEYSDVKKYYQIKNYDTEKAGNLYAYVLERGFSLLLNNGYCGYIIPISSISSTRAKSFQTLISMKELWQSSYSNRPAKLFYGVEQRLTILIMKNNKERPKIYNASYAHWYSEEREILFEQTHYVSMDYICKIGNSIEKSILQKILSDTKPLGLCTEFFNGSEQICYFHDAPTYWIRAMSFNPREGYESEKSNHYKEIHCISERIKNLATSILNSSTFYLFFKTISNCRDFTMKEIEDFRINNDILKHNFNKITEKLMQSYVKNRTVRGRLYASGKIDYYEYYPKDSKPIIDGIDIILSKYYGFTQDELDYIINYDIKYRMGVESGEN